MYAKARKGEIEDFTGISAPFEEPRDADIIVDTETQDVEFCVNKILNKLKVAQRIDDKKYVRSW